MEEIKRELIKKHLEGWHVMDRSSIAKFEETGRVSGKFLIALKSMMDDYASMRLTEYVDSRKGS